MSVGEEMLAKMHLRAPAAGAWIDEDGTSAGSASTSPATADLAAALKPLGRQTRPNGAVYHPRAVAKAFEDVALLRDARDHREHVLFYGPPGTGKTALCEAAFAADATAEHDGLESIVGTADTTESDFLGTFVQDPRSGAFEWRPGPLHRSVMYDVPLLVDEIALIDPRVLSVLYPLMDGRDVLRIPMNPDLEPLPVGKGWFVLAAYNPDVPGARLSEALRDRFAHHIEVGTDWVLAAELGVPDDIIEVAKNLDQLRRKGDLAWSPQLRSLLSYAATVQRRGREYALANLLAKVPQDDRDVVHGVLTKKFGVIHALRLGRRFES
jgi:nitric oxide reductase NorQ protein